MSNFYPKIEVIEEEYEIPQLGAKRKISALLPHDYDQSDKLYPVLYLQDGQNLFNPMAPYGDWAIDKSLTHLSEKGLGGVIIIAVDHGEEDRTKEYLPYDHNKFGKGQGDCYVEFLKDKLIPYVNNHYRVSTVQEHTGIGGSSMGGLISLYAGLKEPSVFGKMMIFSPSLWLSEEIYKDAEQFQPENNSQLYLYAGGKESEAHLPNIRRLESILKNKNDYQLNVSVNFDGQHGEYYWGQEFPNAIKWLYFNN